MRNIVFAALIAPVLSSPSFANPATDGDGLVMSGQSGALSVAGYEILADQVRLPETGGVILSGATLTRPGRDGSVLIRQLEAPDTGLLSQLLDPGAACDPTQTETGTVLARDVRFRPDSDLGVPGGREEIRIPLLTLETSRIGCSWRLVASADGVTVSGVDGSRIDIMTIEGRLRMSGDALRDVDARLDLIGVDLNGAEGPGGLRAEEVGFSLKADLSEGALIDLVGAGAGLSDLLSATSGSVTRGGAYMRGLELVPDLFLSERDLDRLGLDGADPVIGDLELTASLEAGAFRVRASSDLSGLVRGELDLSGSLPDPDGPAVPDAIASAVPVPVELIGIRFERASVSYEDLGAAAVVEHLSGRRPETLVSALIGDRIGRVSARLPGGLPATVNVAWGSILEMVTEGRGAVGVRPETPFSLLEFAVSGMMGPAMAASRTGAWREN